MTWEVAVCLQGSELAVRVSPYQQSVDSWTRLHFGYLWIDPTRGQMDGPMAASRGPMAAPRGPMAAPSTWTRLWTDT